MTLGLPSVRLDAAEDFRAHRAWNVHGAQHDAALPEPVGDACNPGSDGEARGPKCLLLLESTIVPPGRIGLGRVVSALALC